MEMTSKRPRWPGNLTPDPPGGGGALVHHSHQAHVSPVLEVQSPQSQEQVAQAVPHCHGPKQNNLPTASTARAQRWCSRVGAKQLTFAAQIHQDTHCSAQQLHGIGPSPPVLWEASACPAHSTDTERSGCRELQPSLLLLPVLLCGFAHFPTPFSAPDELLECHTSLNTPVPCST